MSTMLDTPNYYVKHSLHNNCHNVRMSLQNRINELLNQNPKIKAADIAKFVGVSRGAVSDWVNGKTLTIAGDNAFKVAKLFNVNPEWVQNGKGSKYINNVPLTDNREPSTQTSMSLSNAQWAGDIDTWNVAGS